MPDTESVENDNEQSVMEPEPPVADVEEAADGDRLETESFALDNDRSTQQQAASGPVHIEGSSRQDQPELERYQAGDWQRTWSHEQLIDELRDLQNDFRRYDKDVAQRLYELRQAIERHELGYWVGVNLYDAFDLNDIHERLTRQSPWSSTALGIAEWIRNILVLVPVLLTWAALAAASKQYQVFLETAPEQEQFMAFLALWENGFGSSWEPRFSTVAMLDVIVILFIVALTFVIHISQDVLQPRGKHHATSMLNRLQNALWKASGVISSYARRETVGGSLLGALDLYKTHADEMLETIAAEQQQLEMLMDHGQAMSNLETLSARTGQLESSVNQAQQVYATLAADIQTLTQLVEQLADHQTLLASEIQMTEDRWHKLGTETHITLRQSFRVMTEQLGIAMEDSSEAAVATREIALEIGQAAANLVSSQSEIARSLEGINQSNTELASQMRRTAAEVVTISQQLGTSQQQATHQLWQALNELKSVEGLLSATTGEIKHAAAQMRTASRGGCLGWFRRNPSTVPAVQHHDRARHQR